MREESTRIAGPLMSAVVTIWLTSSASSCLGTRLAFKMALRRTQAARLTGGKDNALTPSCQSCFHDPASFECCDGEWIARLALLA
jgi:hypothetical protein